MPPTNAIPKGAAVAIEDLLDHFAKIQPGQKVLLLAHIDGLDGGDNLADETAISWIQSAVPLRGPTPLFSGSTKSQSPIPGGCLPCLMQP
ncbi:MAG: hypothetical protein JRJ31_02820 [Deltaproteobacteria bacterium]|nr:hypothetical protein [Deltaproteobacteria bacterium]